MSDLSKIFAIPSGGGDRIEYDIVDSTSRDEINIMKSRVINTLADISANTNNTSIAGALSIKELDEALTFKSGTDEMILTDVILNIPHEFLVYNKYFASINGFILLKAGSYTSGQVIATMPVKSLGSVYGIIGIVSQYPKSLKVSTAGELITNTSFTLSSDTNVFFNCSFRLG